MKSYKDIVGDGGSDVVGQVGEQLDRLNARLNSVRHIIAVMSGKGGVGKSSVTVNLASSLALRGHAVGIFDADINGSSIPKMTGVRGERLRPGTKGMTPPVSTIGVKVVSLDLLLEDDQSPVKWDATSQRDAYTWRGMMEMGAIRELLTDTEWGALDYLFIDLPPGADKLPNMADMLPRISGAVIVTIPSGVSQHVVGKSIRAAKEHLRTPIIGLIENMSSHVCSKCSHEETLFPGDHVDQWADTEGVPYTGKIPFDPRIAMAMDEGTHFMKQHAETPAGVAITDIADAVTRFVTSEATTTKRATAGGHQ